MGILAFIAVVVVALLLLPRVLSSPETRLFRRIWSSENVGGSYGAEKQREAVQSLMKQFHIDFSRTADQVRESVGKLLAAATAFDVRYRNNLGVQTTSVLARELLREKGPSRHPELTAELEYMCRLDAIALVDSVNSPGTR